MIMKKVMTHKIYSMKIQKWLHYLLSLRRDNMDSEKIIIPQSLYDQMIEHGRVTLPYEACGMFSGNNQKIKSFWPLENESKSDRRFFCKQKSSGRNNTESERIR